MLNDKHMINICILPQLERAGEYGWMHHSQSETEREAHSDHLTVNCLFTGSGPFHKPLILKLF